MMYNIFMKRSDKMADIQTVSYDQFTDIPSLGGESKIIFSEKVYKYLNSLINETKIENAEKGCYLVGRKSISEDGALCFYFDFCSSINSSIDLRLCLLIISCL